MRWKFAEARHSALILIFSFATLIHFSGTLKAAAFTASDVGAAGDGSTTAAATGYDLTSRSTQIGGTADQLHFANEQRTGDFDVQVRVENVTITDAFVQAGLLARETLDPGARFAGVFATSAQLGCYFESRATTGAAAQAAVPVTFPVNYPRMYLRLRRVGNVFTGYASFDGISWQQLGTITISLPSTVYFGLGLSSQNSKAIATARFRDVKDVSNPKTFTYSPTTEPLRPSTRFHGIVFSEIMYHPGPQAGTNDAEFIEIYNAESIFIDLSGWRLSGGVDFTFPQGFQLQAGQFAVIAADPAAMARVYGYSRAMGPYSGHLNNGGDTVRLLNAAGAVRLEVQYKPDAPWPVAADGGGHSMVLARPSYGEADPRAWAASELIGGSPGEVDAIQATPLKGVVINEFLAHTDDPVLDFIELYNGTSSDVDISGCVVTDDITTNKFSVPQGTILSARGFISFDQNQLHFSLSAKGETIYFLSPNADRLLDVIRFDGQQNGVSTGRSPDGSPTIRRLASPTPGAANSAWRVEDVVINEIMYDPISGDDADQYVEIYNASTNSVDLSGWQFVAGIDYEFPGGTQIPGGGYFVVAKDRERLLSNYPQLNNENTFGDFGGKLSHSGEHIALAKRDFTTSTNQLGLLVTNTLHIIVSEVSYEAGGRWPELANGGGSSLELIDPRADTLRAPNWAASDETTKAPWTTVDYTATLDNGNGTFPANRIQVIMPAAGECLIDDIQFVPAGSTNIVINGDFETPTNSWKFFGDHSLSSIDNTGGFSGQNVLHVRASEGGDPGVNSVRGTMVRAVTSGTATIRAKVRWLAGWPEVLLRIRGNWIEAPVRMSVPANLGTPGLPNSRRVVNAGPAIYDVTHSPAVPAANQAVLVTCRISDPDPVTQPRLIYRTDPNQTLTTVAMRDDGLAGDVLAGDGIYSGQIPGKGANTLIAFRIQASDDAAQSASTIFPDDAPTRECLIRWGDTIPFGNFAHYHMWNTAATESARNAPSPNNPLNNTFRDATLVYGTWRVIYNAGFRDKGSPYHGGAGDFAVTVPADDMLLGVTDRIFASTSNGGNEETDLRGDVAAWIGEQMGLPHLHAHYMRLYRNGGIFREVLYDMEQPDRAMAKSWFGGGGVRDDLFKISVWFEFDDNNANGTSAATSATLQRFLSGGQYKLARYRWNWAIHPGNESANDYTSIFNLAVAANADRVAGMQVLADMEEWMRVFAYDRILGNWDSWSYSVGQNMYLYAPLGQRAVLMPWDIDFVLGVSGADGPTTALFNAGEDGVVQTLFNLPPYRRMLWRAYQDAMAGPLVAANFQPQIDARRGALLKNGITAPVPSVPTAVTAFMNARRTYIAGQLKAADAQVFAITTNGGADFSTASDTVPIGGTAPFAVATIEVNGVPYPVTWNTATTWTINVPLGAPTNNLQIVGRDLRGNAIGGTNAISVQYSGSVPQPQDWVVINEIMYNSPSANAGYVELYNNHPTFAFDLSGFKLRGVDFTFPSGTFIQPNGFLVIAEDKASFAFAYGPSIPVLGPYSGKLQHGGETLRLVKPGALDGNDLVIDDVRYDSAPPWPAAANGFGPSLQLIDPAQDNWRAANWAVTATNDLNRATPGRANSTRSVLAPFPALWLNEIQPVNTTGILDNAGQREPWIELYNSGTARLDLSGLYLSDDSQEPGKWQFPSGTSMTPGQFLLVWADGDTSQSTSAAPHTNFRISSTNGLVLLSRIQGDSPAVVDYLQYNVTSPDFGYGSYPDGEPRKRRMLYVVTPGAANNASIPGAQIFINEWMAATQSIIRDPADGKYEDWFELYNAGTNTVDLSGYYLSDSIANTTMFPIPPGYRIGPHEWRLIWADGDTTQNTPGSDLHVNFSLSAQGEDIALFTPDGSVVNAITFGAQSENISEGRFPDGADAPFVLFVNPSPDAANHGPFANQVPTIAGISDATINEGQILTFRASATDPDQPPQTITFSLSGEPPGATINPQTGDFSWTPTEAQGPGIYTITVLATDNGTPSRAGSRKFRVNVAEVNQSPALAAIPNTTVDEGSPLVIQLAASDPDLPPQALSLTLGPDAPAGIEIDPATSEFRWTPDESQGGATYNITVRVSDNGQPILFAERTFQITVLKVNNAPVIDTIPPQSLDEGSPFSYQITAHDPDMPPATLTYSLESAPEGMNIDPSTGLITWLPGEAAGPAIYNITVRVGEPGGSPNSTASLFIGVREVNLPPSLQDIADIIATPGQLIVITNQASDADLPAQTLTFSTVGAFPAGASLDANGVFTWQISGDPPAGTNTITIQVTDDGVPSLSTQRSFDIIVRAPPRIAINEIMHRPTAPNAEFVELFNYSAANAVDLSNWRLEGYNFTFPSGTVLQPGGFLCIARDLAAFRSAYGPEPVALGNAAISIGTDGGVIRLVNPAATTLSGVVDETGFSLKTPWPGVAATQGASLQLIDPTQDHRRISNWSASIGGAVTNSPVSLLPITATWKYWQTGTLPGANWAAPGFDESSWPAGGALLYVEESALPASKTTPLTLGPAAGNDTLVFYFRTHFNFAGRVNGATLRFNTVIDDGAVFYLNGQEVFRLGMPAGAVTPTTLANRTVGNAVYEGPFDHPAASLVAGDNVLAAEVHQAASTSSDIVFGTALDAITISSVSSTPGAPNFGAHSLAAIPSVWINEILPNNTSGITDNAGEHDPWIELYNAEDTAVSLDGWSLSDDYSALTKWSFPGGFSIPARGFLLVWADGQVSQETAQQAHAGFRLNPASGTIALSVTQSGVPILADALDYTGTSPNQSYGSALDGNPLQRQLLAAATPGDRNGSIAQPSQPRLAVSIVTGELHLVWTSENGVHYQVQACNDLAAPSWGVAEDLAGTGGTLEHTEKVLSSGSRFYRIVLP